MTGFETDDIINELFESLLRRYQDLETRMDEGSDFVSKVLIYYIIFFIKQVWIEMDHI